MSDPPGLVPVPDPTILTTQALYREIGTLEAQVHRQFDSFQAELDSRLESLRVLDAEKFAKVEQQFELVERQRVEQKGDTKAAVDAALTAQKEAVREQTAASEKAIVKSETATNKLLEQLASTFATEASALRREIGEVKERVNEVDKKASGIVQQGLGALNARTGFYALVFVVLAVLGFIATKGGP